jgi:uncharacterized Zn-binding protein involved in type VI secretion
MGIIGFIVLGDRTSHGGKVLECNSRRTIDGIPVARLGDLVWCPRCNRATKIITSRFPQIKENGIPSAFDMDMTDCGALLYSRHNNHAGYGSNAPTSNRATAASSTAKATAISSGNGPSVQEHFVFHDTDTGKGIVGLKYTLTSNDGRAIQGETDEHGRTGIVWTDSPNDLEVLLHAPHGESDDPYHFSETSSEDS